MLTYLIAFILSKDAKISLLAGLILLTVGAFWDAGRQVRMDVPVTAAILFSIYCFLRGLEDRRWFLGFGTGLALGVLTKSIIGFFPVPIALIIAAVYGDWSWLKSKWLWLSAVFFLVLALPWHIYEYMKFGAQFLSTYFVYHVFQRFAEPILGGSNGNFFYLKNLFIQAQPWIVIFPVALITFIWKYRAAAFKKKSETALLYSIVFIFLTFFFAKTKLFYYLVPVYPFLALFLATVLVPAFSGKKRLSIVMASLLLGVFVTGFQSFYPEQFDGITYPKGVTSKYTLANDERSIGAIIKKDPAPVYLYQWPYRDTLTYYGDAPEFIALAAPTIPPAPSFLLMPSVFINPDFTGSKEFTIVYKGKAGTLFRRTAE